MSLIIAQRHAWSLAHTLMVCVTLFHAGSKKSISPAATQFQENTTGNTACACVIWLFRLPLPEAQQLSLMDKKHLEEGYGTEGPRSRVICREKRRVMEFLVKTKTQGT